MEKSSTFNNSRIKKCGDIVINYTTVDDALINKIENLTSEKIVLTMALRQCIRVIEQLKAASVEK